VNLAKSLATGVPEVSTQDHAGQVSHLGHLSCVIEIQDKSAVVVTPSILSLACIFITSQAPNSYVIVFDALVHAPAESLKY
jgi:hypothetical protein